MFFFNTGMPQKGGMTTMCGHLYVKFEIKFPENGELTENDIAALRNILPEEKSDDNDVKMSEKNTNNNNTSNNNNNTNTSNKNKGKNQTKRNKKKNKGKKNKKNKNNNNNNNAKQQAQQQQSQTQAEMDDEEEDSVLEDHVTADDVDGEPKTTPASARSAYDEDEETEGVQCRHM